MLPETTTTSPEIGDLATALAKAQAVMTGAIKSGTNPHFKSKYADLASVWDACRGPLTAHGLSVVQLAEGSGTTITVTSILLHTSGQWIRGTLSMTAAQNTPQALGSCLTYCRRYALSALVGIAPEDDDGNTASSVTTTRPARSVPSPAVVATAGRDDLPEGYVYLEEVTAAEWGGTVTLSNGEILPCKGKQLTALAETLVQEGAPVRVVTTVAPRTGKTVITELHRKSTDDQAKRLMALTTPAPALTESDIAF